ncbi:MAG: DUF1592 domain-containing protein [Planctomycetales bacterium]|nr:DUF1592 domain-containing protein [Planctomycetales bacterium]
MYRTIHVTRRRSLVLGFLASLLSFSTGDAAEQTAFLREHCIRCHGVDTQEGDLRLDTLVAPGQQAERRATWSSVVAMVEAGDMPPEGENRPADEDVQAFLTWVGSQMAVPAEPLSALRRLNRTEYEYTVQDLLGIDVSLAELLPEDSSRQGFDNVAGGLGISSIQMMRYLEAADVAFEATIRRIQPLPAETRRVQLMEIKENIESVEEEKGGVIESHGSFVDFTSGWPPARIDPAHPIEDGMYRCRIAVWPHEPNDHRTLTVAVFVGPLFGPGKRELMGVYDVTGTPEEPRIIEFTTRMSAGHTMHILPWIYPEHVTYRDKHEARPGVGIAWAETHGPLDQMFPAPSQVRLFGDSETLEMAAGEPIWMRHRRGVKLHYVDSQAPHDDVARILRDFVPRAFRRPIDDALTDQFVQLALSRLDSGSNFEQAVRAGVTAVLCSPHFLLLNQESEIDDYTIASRLSYFLWSSMPDETLLQLAAVGELSDPSVRATQVERMMDDPKFERFVENFTGQWLNLRDIEFTTPDQKLYPEYDELLLHSMVEETRGFFRHILRENLSVLNFVDSDFAILNQRMAAHYGIEGVRGHEQFRVVALPEECVRGGVLTHASVLKVTANGTNTSPVIRGAWVLDRVLGQPAPPPPPGVPAVEPDIRGATTIREQLDRHRNTPSCARCHRRIDPPGFALEEFDVIGGLRQRYRALGDRKDKSIDWVKNTQYGLAEPVNAAGELPDGRTFTNSQEYRRLLLAQPDVIAQAIATKLLIYGCGRPITAAERASVDAVVGAAKEGGYGLRSMIHAVVETDLFLGP